MKVGIVGAGIAGLATAIALDREGAEVSVFERTDAAGTGAGISLFGNGLRALAEIGVVERVLALGRPPDLPAGLRTPSGRWLQRTPTSGVDLAVVHRMDLQRILTEEAPTVRQAEVQQVDRVPGGATVLLASGERQTFDLVVGADGIGSRIRASWPADPGIRYAGYTAWRGVTDEPVTVPAAGETWGRGERFGIASLGDGRVYWFAVASVPRHWTVPDDRAELLRRFGGWHHPIPELLRATPADTLLRNDILDLAGPLDTFVRGRVALVGDAAHAMTPNLGQGGNQALEDAVTLGALLRRHTDLDAALADYDSIRRARSQPIARMSWQLGRVAQARGLVGGTLRDTLMWLTPTRLTARSATRIQSWRP